MTHNRHAAAAAAAATAAAIPPDRWLRLARLGAATCCIVDAALDSPDDCRVMLGEMCSKGLDLWEVERGREEMEKTPVIVGTALSCAAVRAKLPRLAISRRRWVCGARCEAMREVAASKPAFVASRRHTVHSIRPVCE